MIDHVTYKVKNLATAKRFYQAALQPLGYALTSDATGGAGFGQDQRTYVWMEPGQPQGPWHIALMANSRKAVDAFHAAALAHGGKDNGLPGPRPDYSPTYYAAFVLDPDGNNIEAVCLK